MEASIQGPGDVVRLVYERIATGDFPGVLALMAPDVVWEWSPTMPDTGVFRGHEEALEAAERWRESWEKFGIELIELEERGGEVVAHVRYTATGRESGLAMNEGRTHVWEVRDGLVARWRMFSTFDEAERGLR
jgi:ketosteroid isomerase-like protein